MQPMTARCACCALTLREQALPNHPVAFLRERQPETIIFWAQDDIFFTRAGGEAYLQDLPKAEMHRLEAGHFAVEDCLDYISENMHRFYRDSVAPKAKR
jgi:hypothetical protein